MAGRIAINGLGRIGRAIFKLVLDDAALELVAVNDVVDVENLAYLLRFDTVYGRTRNRWRPARVTSSSLSRGSRRWTAAIRGRFHGRSWASRRVRVHGRPDATR